MLGNFLQLYVRTFRAPIAVQREDKGQKILYYIIGILKGLGNFAGEDQAVDQIHVFHDAVIVRMVD